ncbi:MAG: Gfo/Idh/MocA family oxidoreductase [Chloroflexi bacterium]|nr:Gfo/Idh/MocA family oxidoreductase [Chloroflexota bacterium]
MVAACDPWSSVAAHQALPEATVHDTVAALLCHPALDLVVALRRPRHGADVVRAIIESGLPAIVEKPVACDAAALAPLAEAAQMRHSWLTVPFAARYSPLWSVLGTADDLLSAHLRIVNGPPQRYAAAGCGWMLDPAESGGCAAQPRHPCRRHRSTAGRWAFMARPCRTDLVPRASYGGRR